jgi:hypothetical protein
MKRLYITVVLTFSSLMLFAQQYALFNTKTLFDSFENPAQKSFILDSSRQYASNFFLPYADLSSLSRGNSDKAVTALVRNGYQQSRIGAFANPATVRENVNVYLLAFRMFEYHKYHSEMGFSWQIKSDTEINYDEKVSLGYFDTFEKFSTIPRINIFNNNAKLQTYHQISFNYRENYTKRWSLGARISLLSGIGYSEFNATQSDVNLDANTKEMKVRMRGNYRLNYPEDDDISFSKLLPFKNLGASITIGATHLTNDGIFLMGNVKDLGFITWGGTKSFSGDIDVNKDFYGMNNEIDMYRAMQMIGEDSGVQKSFTTPINSRVDFLISKNFGIYSPSLIVTKNIFSKYGDVALVNTFKSADFSISATPMYTTDKNFRLGLQMMYKTPNFEFFGGTNDILKSYYSGKDFIGNDMQPTGYNRGSFYVGMAFKIGYVVEHPMNMSWMPGTKNSKERKGVFRNIFNTLQFWKKN